MSRVIKAIPANSEEFKKYGTCYNLMESSKDVKFDIGKGWSGGYGKNTLIDKAGSLGMTQTEDTVPFVVTELERHLHTKEAMMCFNDAIVFAVALPSPEAPEISQTMAFILYPGETAIVDIGVWHSPAHGIEGPVRYYWMAEAYDGDPTLWAPINDGPVEVQI